MTSDESAKTEAVMVFGLTYTASLTKTVADRSQTCTTVVSKASPLFAKYATNIAAAPGVVCTIYN